MAEEPKKTRKRAVKKSSEATEKSAEKKSEKKSKAAIPTPIFQAAPVSREANEKRARVKPKKTRIVAVVAEEAVKIADVAIAMRS